MGIIKAQKIFVLVYATRCNTYDNSFIEVKSGSVGSSKDQTFLCQFFKWPDCRGFSGIFQKLDSGLFCGLFVHFLSKFLEIARIPPIMSRI